jgi:hypothetical protein
MSVKDIEGHIEDIAALVIEAALAHRTFSSRKGRGSPAQTAKEEVTVMIFDDEIGRAFAPHEVERAAKSSKS